MTKDECCVWMKIKFYIGRKYKSPGIATGRFCCIKVCYQLRLYHNKTLVLDFEYTVE